MISKPLTVLATVSALLLACVRASAESAQPSGPFTIEATQGWQASQVKSVGLLGSVAPVSWTMTAQGLCITPPSDLGSSLFAWSFKIVTDQVLHPTNAR